MSNSIFSFAKSVCVCVSRPIYGSLRAMHDQCYATLCIQSDSPGQHGRSWGKTEPHMFRLFAALLLNYTRLPLYVVHNEGVHPLAILADAVPLKSLYGLRPQVHPFKVDVIKSSVRLSVPNRHYESTYTKFHVWRLPCRQVTYVDYDVLTVRSPDAIFGECGNATFCAVQARGEVDHYFNSGVFVARPDNVTFVKFKNAIRADEDVHRAHEYPDQDMLNDMYWDWKALPSRYNVQSIGNGGPWDPDSDVFIHQKYWMLPDAVRDRLRVPPLLPKPSWLDHVRQFFGHLW